MVVTNAVYNRLHSFTASRRYRLCVQVSGKTRSKKRRAKEVQLETVAPEPATSSSSAECWDKVGGKTVRDSSALVSGGGGGGGGGGGAGWGLVDRRQQQPSEAATLAEHARPPSLHHPHHTQHPPPHHRILNLGPSRQVKISPVKLEDMADGQPLRKRRLSLCVGCGAQIHDQYILRVAPDLEWHAACLKCAECHQFLDETCTCFVRDGKTYCKRDYVRLFGTKCDKCGLSFSKNDFVMRAKTKIYHIECFRCTACERQLIPGDEFALRDDGLFCKEDHEVLDKTCPPENNNNSTNVNNNNSNIVHNEGSNSDSSESGSNKGGRDSGGGCRSGGGNSAKVSSDGKPTRVRTVLNEKQLHTLRTCYAANPRPDALMKEQLVEMTSLSPRVIRVWFQNKRCKDKKRALLMKQQMQQEKDGRKLGYGGMQGIPMVASSPVRHESPLGMNPIEVHSYQPPWKALSDFALHTDLERLDPSAPPFQHLVNQMHGYDIHGPPPHHDLAPPPPEVGHPDSTDSYVTYLESDDSLHQDGSSP